MKNEEFNLLQHALNIEEGLENLRYNKNCNSNRCRCGRHAHTIIADDFFPAIFPRPGKAKSCVYFRNAFVSRARQKRNHLLL